MLSEYIKDPVEALKTRPKHVAFVGLGKSKTQFVNAILDYTHFQTFPEEVWGINSASVWLRCHKLFIMDGFKHQYQKQKTPGASLYAEWMKQHETPVITSEPDPKWPCTIAYPLQEVIDETQFAIFGNTLSYMFGYAMTIGVEMIDCFGADFEYPDKHGNWHYLEKGDARASTWAGLAIGRGINVRVHTESRFLNGGQPEFYGYKDVPEVTLPGGGRVVGSSSPSPTIRPQQVEG